MTDKPLSTRLNYDGKSVPTPKGIMISEDDAEDIYRGIEFASEYRYIGEGWDIHSFRKFKTDRCDVTLHTPLFHVYLMNVKCSLVGSNKRTLELRADSNVLRFFIK